MGFGDLALVTPKDTKVCNRAKVIQRASGATDVLKNAQVFSSLGDALDGTNVWCGTGMPHDMYQKRTERSYLNPRDFFEQLAEANKLETMSGTEDVLVQNLQRDQIQLALIFGSEKTGMDECDMDMCHTMLGIPTNPNFSSLNLAAAVQLIAYDWRVAIGGHGSYQSIC